MDLDAALERLTASGLISRRGTPPDATYAFKHALVQDAAYATLLKSRRRQLHARIAKVLVERFAAMAENQPEVVAHHFTEAGLASEAIAYWVKAGRLAQARWANREAVTSFEQALHLLDAQPETRETLELAIDLRFDLRTSLLQLGEFERSPAISAKPKAWPRHSTINGDSGGPPPTCASTSGIPGIRGKRSRSVRTPRPSPSRSVMLRSR